VRALAPPHIGGMGVVTDQLEVAVQGCPLTERFRGVLAASQCI
jgi:hypothetical protein